MKFRVEPFGAWVELDDSTLVAIDRATASAHGIHGDSMWDDTRPAAPTAPLEAHVAVTSRCPVACTGCYQNASPAGHEVGTDSLLETLDTLANAGVFTVAFGGGEPNSRDDLPELGRAARDRGITPVVTTSGIGLTPERARALAVFAQVNVSHDGVAGAYRAVRGFDGAALADRAIELLVAAGVRVGVNFVLTRESFEHAEATADHVRSLGACEVQLLRYKPGGRAASLAYLATRLTVAQSREVYPLIARLATKHAGALSVRVDCAMVPFFSPYVSDASALAQWGVFGCEAGRHLTAVDRVGAIAPCSFVAAGRESGGTDGSLDRAWTESPEILRFRAFAASPPEPCASCAIQSVCRGGCKVVSDHLVGAFVPDPECPRVIALS